MTARVLVVDDVAANVKLLDARLTAEYFEVRTARSGPEALHICARERADVVLLDVQLPDHDGFVVCRRLRTRGIDTPILLLTGRGGVKDRVRGLDAGADDYLAKPVELRELLARVRSVLRRSAPAAAPGQAPGASGRMTRFGTKWLDVEAQILRDDDGNEHALTASEYGLLKVFAANPKRVLSRERLLDLANARDAEAFDRAIDLRIMRIRRVRS